MAINKPADYDNVQAFTDFEPLAAGGYVCIIKNVQEFKSKTDKKMIKISLDIAEGNEKNRFLNDFQRNTSLDRKWGCVLYQLLEGKDGSTNRGFKTFVETVIESNSGFSVKWGEKFCDCFKEKLVGCVFGREQYLNKMGELRWSTKPKNFKTIQDIREGKFRIPEDKYLEGQEDVPDGFQIIDDDDIPF